MSNSNQQSNKKRSKYKTITEQTRQELIKRIQQGENIKDISFEMGLNISTCKAIVKVYKQEGRVGKKKRRNKVINVVETFSFYSIDGMKLQQLAPMKIQESKMKANNDQSLDKELTQKSSIKAEKFLKETIDTKKKVQEVMMQQNIFETLNGLNNFGNFTSNAGVNGFEGGNTAFVGNMDGNFNENYLMGFNSSSVNLQNLVNLGNFGNLNGFSQLNQEANYQQNNSLVSSGNQGNRSGDSNQNSNRGFKAVQFPPKLN